MSKFIKAVRERVIDGADSMPPWLPFLTVNCNERPDEFRAHMIELELSVRWLMRIKCFKREIPLVKTNAIRQLHEELYSEFRNTILQLERAVYEQNHAEAVSCIDKLMLEVYGY